MSQAEKRIRELFGHDDTIPGVPWFWLDYCKQRALRLTAPEQEEYVRKVAEPLCKVMSQALERVPTLLVTTEHVRCEIDAYGFARYLRLPPCPFYMCKDSWLTCCAAGLSEQLLSKDLYRVIFLVAFLAALPPRKPSWVRNHYARGCEYPMMAQGLSGLYCPDLAAFVIESYLGLEQHDYDDLSILTEKLNRGLNSDMRRMIDKSNCVVVLSDALRAQAGRGASEAVALFQAYLRMPNVKDVSAGKLKVKRGWLDLISAKGLRNNTSIVVQTMAHAMIEAQTYGPAVAARFLEGYLEVTENLYCNTEDLAKWLATQDFRDMNGNDSTRLHLIETLAGAKAKLESPGPSHGAALIEAAIGLESQDYSDQDVLQSKLDSPWNALEPRQCGKGTVVGVLATFAECFLRGSQQEASRAVSVVEAFLHLNNEVYRKPDELAQRLRERMRIAKGDLSNSALHIIKALAKALLKCDSKGAGKVRAIARALPPAQVFQERSPFPSDAIEYAALYLTCLSGTDDDAVPLCHSVVEFVRSVRDEQLPTYQHRFEFLRQVRNIWPLLQRIAMEWTYYERTQGTLKRVEQNVLELLSWSEQFENRLLLERMVAHVPDWSDQGDAVTIWSCNSPGLWNVDYVQQRYAILRQPQSYLPHSQQHVLSGGMLSGCLCVEGMFQEDGSRGTATNRGRKPDRSREIRQTLLDEEVTEFHKLLPEGVVWVRGMFDHNGCLYWWACSSDGAEIRMLTYGESDAGAVERLTLANLKFDIGVEKVWSQARAVQFSGQTLGALEAFSKRREPNELRLLPDELITELGKKGLFQLANLGRSLREGPGYADPNFEQLVELWMCEINHLWRTNGVRLQSWREPWQELIEYELLLNTENEGPAQRKIRDAEAALERRRRKELDTLSMAHLAALAAEFDLSPLWDKSGPSFPWSETDILFTMPGPLLAMPLAWLDLGGETVFRRVASTSTVCSLTLWNWSAKKRLQAGDVPRKLLSALWDEPERRSQMPGLTRLQFLLEGLENWEVWRMGDDLRATRDNFIAALNHPQRKFGVVVVGAHGNMHRAGVRLAPPQDLDRSGLGSDAIEEAAHWCGEGADLSSVDLLILVSCAVGRLRQEGDRDVEGLYAQLVGQGASTVVAARWSIADVEAAEFAAEIVRQYLNALKLHEIPVAFSRARAFNRARIAVLDREGDDHVTHHLVAAFELYGLG